MLMNLVRVTEDKVPVLARLLELYEYEFSGFEHTDVNEDGCFGYPYLKIYFTEPKRFAYFIEVDHKLAGFVMVCDYCYVSQDDRLFMAEFFVMKKYRQLGVGRQAAQETFFRHKGKWELTVHPNNPISQVFWESVIAQIDPNYQTIEGVKDVYDHHLAKAYLFEVK
jgi:predicted acetyltransferase